MKRGNGRVGTDSMRWLSVPRCPCLRGRVPCLLDTARSRGRARGLAPHVVGHPTAPLTNPRFTRAWESLSLQHPWGPYHLTNPGVAWTPRKGEGTGNSQKGHPLPRGPRVRPRGARGSCVPRANRRRKAESAVRRLPPAGRAIHSRTLGPVPIGKQRVGRGRTVTPLKSPGKGLLSRVGNMGRWCRFP